MNRFYYHGITDNALVCLESILNAGAIHNQSSLSVATIHSSLENLVDLGILEEVSKKKRNKIYAYKEYIHILNEGTE